MRLIGSVPSVVPMAAAQAAPKAGDAGSLRVAQMNLWNFFDPIDDPSTPQDGDAKVTPTPEQYAIKVQKIANAIVELGTPDLISVNEIEGEVVLKDLIASPALKDAGYKYVVQSLNDERGIRVGVLYRESKLEQVGEALAPNPEMSFRDLGKGQINSKLLYARAPLVIDFKLRGAAQATEGAGILTVAVNHFKSKLGGAAPEARRQMQGQYLGEWLDARRATNPGGTQLVLGDLNGNYGDGSYEKLANRADGSKRYHDAPLALKPEDRYTYIYRGEKDMLDHMLVTAGREDAIKSVKILHVNSPKGADKFKWDPKVLAGFSDHDPMVTEFDVAKLLATG